MELLLLATEKIEENKWYLYTMEMVYQKIVRIIKKGTAEELGTNWRIGFITKVNSISAWPFEENTFVTNIDQIKEKHNNFEGLMLNKASCPERIICSLSGISYGILRLKQLEILDKGKIIESIIWGLGTRHRAIVLDPWWIKYWNEKYSKESAEKYQIFLSASKNKVFAIVQNKVSGLTILKLIVL